MLNKCWPNWFKQLFKAARLRKPSRRISKVRPCFEVLEDRALPSVLYNEAISGDLSNNQSAPTARTLALGTNSVLGTVGDGSDFQDWITLHVPSGMVLSSIVLTSYVSTDVQGFIGVQSGTAFAGSPFTASSYLGYAHFGTSATNGSLPPTNLVGTDLLPIMGNTSLAAGSQGFVPPLSSGDYTFLIQQLGASTAYQFDFGVSSVSPADLTITKSHVGIFHPGDSADTYTITVGNAGNVPTNGASVTVTDTLPIGLLPTAADNGSINGWTVSSNGQTVTATRSNVLGAHANYPVLTITVSVANNIASSVINTATVAGGGEVNTANDTATDPTATTTLADLTISSGHAGSFHQGDAADNYTLTVKNTGPGPSIGAVTITDVLPAGLAPTAADTGLINGWLVSFQGQTITATRSDVLAGGNSYPSLKLTVRVAGNAPVQVTNFAHVAGGGEIVVNNDTAFDVTSILERTTVRRRRGA